MPPTADPQRHAVRRLSGVGEWGPGEVVLALGVRTQSAW